MADFIHFEAEIDSSDDDETIDNNVSERSFIDNVELNDSRNFYRQFANVENDLDQVLSDVRNEALQDIEQFGKISNLNDDSENETEVDDFQGSQDYVEKFNKTLFPIEYENQNQLCQVMLQMVQQILVIVKILKTLLIKISLKKLTNLKNLNLSLINSISLICVTKLI